MKKIISTLGLIGILNCSNPISPVLSPEQQYEEMMNNEWRTEENIKKATEKMEEARAKLYTLDDVNNLIKKFKTRSEERNWQSDILTLFHYDLWGDCEDASILGIWALENIGIKARELYLYDIESYTYHSICVSDDNKIMISNNLLLELQGYDLLREIKMSVPLFYGRYDYIAKETMHHNQGMIE